MIITEQRFHACAVAFISMLLFASCDWLQGPTTSEPEALPKCDPVQPRPPCDPTPTDPALVPAIRVVEGDTQVANVGSALPKPLTVLVTNLSNAPLANVVVRWSSSLGVLLSASTTKTDANGRTQIQLTLGASAGEFTTFAALDGNPATFVAFTSLAQVNGAYRIKEKTGDSGLNQVDTVFARLSHPYKVSVTDYKGAPVAGVAVGWLLDAGAGVLSASTTLTDENGVAEVTHTLGSRPGHIVVSAWAPGLVNSPFVFITDVRPGRSTSIAYVEGTNQVGLVNQEVWQPYIVRTFDAYGNPTNANNIDWSVASGGGTLRLLNPASAMHKLGPGVGEQTVTASLPGVSERVLFIAYAASAIVGIGDPYCYGESAFYPKDVVIPVGGAVAWVWYQGFCSTEHNVTFEDDPNAPTSSGTGAAATFTRRFLQPGTIRYRCTLHSRSFTEGEVGAVKVE